MRLTAELVELGEIRFNPVLHRELGLRGRMSLLFKLKFQG